MKKMLTLLLALLLALAAAGCGETGYFEKTVTDPASIRIGMEAEPMTLDPGRYTTLEEATLISHLFEGLTTEDTDGAFVGAVAKSWEVTTTADAAKRPVYTFKLRENAAWSDGTPVKAADFVYAWKRVISGEAESPYAYLFDVIYNAMTYAEDAEAELGLEAKDDTTLVVTLEGDCAYFPALLALPVFVPVREDIVSQNAEGWVNDPATLIGNGAYMMTEWVHDDHITMTKNEKYRAAGEIVGTALDFVLRSGEAMQKAEKDGTLQAAFTADNTASQEIMRSGLVYYYCINTDTVTDVRVRQALTTALNRMALDKNTIAPAYRLTAGEPLVVENAEAAGVLLAEAETVPESLTLLTNYVTSEQNDANVMMAQFAAAQWQDALGIKVTVKSLPYDEFVAARDKGEFDIVRCGMAADFDDPAAYLELFESDSVGNYANYQSKEYNTLLTDSRSELTAVERNKLLAQAENLLIAEDAAVIPLKFGTITLSHHDTLTGMTCNGLGIWNFANAVYAEKTAATGT